MRALDTIARCRDMLADPDGDEASVRARVLAELERAIEDLRLLDEALAAARVAVGPGAADVGERLDDLEAALARLPG